MNKITLLLDLSRSDGNIFMVIVHARSLLTGQTLRRFNADIKEALMPEAGKQFRDILNIVNSYVHLVDTSRTYQFSRE